MVARFATRSFLTSTAIVLIVLAHTPFNLPTYFFAFVPLMTLWRGQLAPSSVRLVILEALIIGVIIGWMITPFFTQAASKLLLQGIVLHVFCCMIFSLSLLTCSLAIWLTRSWSILTSAPVIALATVLADLSHALGLEISWIGSNSALAVAMTPVVQWVEFLTPFGLSALIYWLGCLWVPEFSQSGIRRWRSTLAAGLGTLALWFGGWIVELSVTAEPLGITALLVQPNRSEDDETGMWIVQHQNILESISDHGNVDLIIWPEGFLGTSEANERTQVADAVDLPRDGRSSLSLIYFRRELLPQYKTNCLVGVTIREPGLIEAYRVRYPAICTYNCGCLVSPLIEVDCHKKLALMPIRENIPDWFHWFPELQHWLLGSESLSAKYQPGEGFLPLSFDDVSGKRRRIGVAICYESWLPWLPQYKKGSQPLDAICHLAYDGAFVDYPEVVERMLLTIRLRAIETRTWQLVCSHFRGTAIIDPRGRIVRQLDFGPGVLRTDK